MAERLPSMGTPNALPVNTLIPNPMVQIVPPLSERSLDGLPEPETVLEASLEEDEMAELVAGFREEIDESRQRYANKKRDIYKVHCYLKGEDPIDPPEDYQQSTFFYRRLPRLVTIAKTKVLKNVCPLEGHPYVLEPSAIPPGDPKDAAVSELLGRVAALRKEVADIFDTVNLDDMLDDVCGRTATDGTYFFYGPSTLSQPAMRNTGGFSKDVPAEEGKKPMWRGYEALDVFPDASAKMVAEADVFHFRHLWSKHQMRSLKRDNSFDQEALAKVLETFPQGNWSEESEEWDDLPSNPNRYVVWLRTGFIDADVIELLRGQKLIPEPIPGEEDNERLLVDSLWEIWFCGDIVLKASRRAFQPEQMPVMAIPFFRDVTGLMGIGVGEAAIDIQEMLINITRAIDDDLADTSGFQAVVDAGSVMNKSLEIRGRKTWITRKSGKDEGRRPPVEFFRPPTNLQHLIACFQLFESMIPICTGIPEQVTGLDMGSGVRTNMMHNDVWSALEDFLKETVGSVDRFFWKPILRDTYEWISAYHPRKMELRVDPIIKVMGVRGALRREIVGRKAQEFIVAMKQNNDSGWINEPEIMASVIEGLGLDSQRGVLTPEQYVQRKAVEMQEERLRKQSGMDPEMLLAKERAHMSARDVISNAYQSTEKNNPVWLALAEQLFETTGTSNPRVQAALAIWARVQATYYQRLGLASPEEAAALQAPFTAESPLELEPGFRDEAGAAAAKAQQNVSPLPGPDPVPAVSMEAISSLMSGGTGGSSQGGPMPSSPTGVGV